MDHISAIILAAGRSTRMGSSKMLLPWNEKTVLETVIGLATDAKLAPIVVVTGAYHGETLKLITKFTQGVEEIHNPDFAQLEMFHSLKMGVKSLIHRCSAAVIFLGDQPQIEPDVILQIITRFNEKKSQIIIPSFQMRRGHPILIQQDLFPEIMATSDDSNLKEFLARYKNDIDFVVVNTPSVLQDMDSPEDYHRIKDNHKK